MARQWHVECDCVPALAEERITQHWIRMHTEITHRNRREKVRDGRVSDGVTVGDLAQLVDRADTVVACNVCGSVKADHGDGFVGEVVSGVSHGS